MDLEEPHLRNVLLLESDLYSTIATCDLMCKHPFGPMCAGPIRIYGIYALVRVIDGTGFDQSVKSVFGISEL
jgi:hypothetical protein